jgi:hypothetical protein
MKAFDELPIASLIGLTCLLLCSLPVEAVIYPVNDVGCASSRISDFKDEVCFTVKHIPDSFVRMQNHV